MRKRFKLNSIRVGRYSRNFEKDELFFFMSMCFVNIISFDRSYQFLGESSKSRSRRVLSGGGINDWKLWTAATTTTYYIILLSFTPLFQLGTEKLFCIGILAIIEFFLSLKILLY